MTNSAERLNRIVEDLIKVWGEDSRHERLGYSVGGEWLLDDPDRGRFDHLCPADAWAVATDWAVGCGLVMMALWLRTKREMGGQP